MANQQNQQCSKLVTIVLVVLGLCCIAFTIYCITEPSSMSRTTESYTNNLVNTLTQPINLQNPTLPVEIAPNQYESCGPCIPSENPNIWIKRCIVKNINGYPLGSYVMTKLCSECVDSGNNTISCNSYNQPSGTFEKNIEFKKPRGTMCS